ncbi:MAG: tyrosine-type recombinase/integrase, partial [Proteobacteria bacterium]|nr:tyrosine-type recombinase/integrase [Pseudomonadota bacterium]
MATWKRFTDKQIAAFKPKAKRYTEWEASGLGIRITPRSVKSWGWLYRYDRVSTRMTFGQYPVMSLRDARLALAQAQKIFANGQNPGKLAVQKRHAEQHAETVEELVEAYLKGHARPKKRTAAEDERSLKKDVVSRWGQRKARSITTQEIVNLLDDVVDRGSPYAANRLGSTVRKMFQWAKRRGIVDINPAADIELPGKETPRQRILNTEEIRKFWTGLDNTTITPTVQLALKLLLATATRRSEVTQALVSEFDLAEQVWIIPAARSKNGKAHSVPLSPLAVALFKEAKVIAGDSGYLFPSPRNPDVPLSRDTVTRALQVNGERLGLKDVRVHDLRRTASSNMSALGVPRHVRERVLNHSVGRLDQSYD